MLGDCGVAQNAGKDGGGRKLDHRSSSNSRSTSNNMLVTTSCKHLTALERKGRRGNVDIH